MRTYVSMLFLSLLIFKVIFSFLTYVHVPNVFLCLKTKSRENPHNEKTKKMRRNIYTPTRQGKKEMLKATETTE